MIGGPTDPLYSSKPYAPTCAIGGSICEEIPPNPQHIDTKGLSTESGTIFYAY